MDVITRHAREIERNLNRVHRLNAGYDANAKTSSFATHGANCSIRQYGPVKHTISADDRKKLYRRLSRALAYHRINRTAQAINEVHKLSDELRRLGIGD